MITKKIFLATIGLLILLESGGKVVVAHGASRGQGKELDHPDEEPKENFDLFMRLMGDLLYNPLVFDYVLKKYVLKK